MSNFVGIVGIREKKEKWPKEILPFYSKDVLITVSVIFTDKFQGQLVDNLLT